LILVKKAKNEAKKWYKKSKNIAIKIVVADKLSVGNDLII
jgi:hypothetical protein